MLITKDIQEEKVFDTVTNSWTHSDMRTYLNGTWLSSKPTLQQYAVSTTIRTRSYDGIVFGTTSDKVFLLSEADVYGTEHSQAARVDDYTYNGAKLPAPGGSWAANYQNSSHWYWLRSPGNNKYFLDAVDTIGSSYGVTYNSTDGGIRPAVWVQLAP